MNANINYKMLSEAINFYKKLGYEYIEVPWVVDEQFDAMTRPEDKLPLVVDVWGKNLVASGEQSLLSITSKLSAGKYVCLTPCFRDEVDDDIHSRHFMKVELMHYNIDVDRFQLMNDAMKFYKTYLPEDKLTFANGDIMIKVGDDFFEVGSYDITDYSNQDHTIRFGTGLAEPRFSMLCNRLPKGYHNDIIHKTEVGTIDKIYEEYNEIVDAINSNNKIMELVELSDLYGAIEMYISNRFNNITMEDLKIMSDSTVKAFKNGRR